ncbi:MFS transporter [Salmonella enterica subsp. enterica]|nr:MFS transporter [Salmonella enterica subsp. enterica]EDR2615891.1 MFS transporter [Salmonella enterica subsp. enterica]EGI5586405.1 MFS transporter [Salmonella enterica subsp. enterica serovar Butantan]
MTRYTTTDVLICGAGVTGLTLAIELARHGVSFRLIEKRTTPFTGSRGKGIQPRTQEIFEDLGILNKVVAAGGLYPRLRTYRHDGSYVDSDIAHHTKPTHAEPYHLLLMVPQNVTETIMREQLKAWGHRVEFGCELRHFAQTPRTVTAYVAGPAGEEVIIAHYLIGADGGGSFVRKKLGVSFPGHTLGIHALVADASLSGLNRDVWHHFNDGDMARMIMICPLAGTQLFQIQALLAPDDSQNFSADVLTAFLTERIGRTDVRIHSIPWVSKYQMNARIAEHYRVGKVFLAGDAAHVHPPAGGQGLNTSIQDAYNLGWKMAVMSVLPFYIREMGGSPLIIGIIIATEAFSQFCAAPLIGHLSDRVGRKRILIVTLAIAAISLLLLANAQCILFILLARTLFGISAGNLSAAAAYIADCTHVRNRRQAIGILTGCIGLGGIVGAGVSGWLSRISLSAPIYAAFILVLGSALVAIWGLKDPSTTSRTADKIAAFSARAILKMPVLRVLIIVMLCHFFAYGMYSSQLPVFLSDTFIWNGLPFGPKALSYLLMADGVINIFVQLFLLGWVSQYFSERKLIILIFALLCTGFLTAGIATTIPVLIFAIVCISIADALAKPTYLAALSVHVSPARQGIVIGTAQALIAIADFISPVLGGFVLGYALYGVWIGIAISVAIIGLVTAMIYLSKSSVLIAKPETE